MDLHYRCIPALPKLAWLAVVDRSGPDGVRVYHGPFVEVHDDFFIEGVWNGPFAEGDFARTDCIFGTGAVVRHDGITFVSSATTTDYLYYCRSERAVLVANSLPLLLAHTADSLDPTCTGYDRINSSITEGIRSYVRQIPTRCGTVTRLMYDNLFVSADEIREIEKQMPPRFGCFDEYFAYVKGNYGLIAKNARDVGRREPMAIFSTQSRGYDTTATNAIARDFGIDRVFTITKGKGAGRFADRDRRAQVDDDGTEVARILGLECVPIERRAFEVDFTDEYLYYATLHCNQDANFKEINKYVDRVAILLTGTLGEIWYTWRSYYQHKPNAITPDLVRGDLGGHGLSETRLIAGFVQVPLPYIAARRREDIFRITESPDMAPWRLNTSYDRPIARRIAEEAGIPRGMFGQRKMASVVEFAPPHVPYGDSLRKEYLAFIKEHRLLSGWKRRCLPLARRVNALLTFAGSNRHRWIYYVQRAASHLIGREYKFPLVWNRLDGSVFCFCVNRRVKDYDRMLSSAS
jgi:hypothetical protein